MPEAISIVAVFVIVAAMYFAARAFAQSPAQQDAANELRRLQHQVERLEERLARARRENWGHEMTASITAELATINGQLAQASARAAAK